MIEDAQLVKILESLKPQQTWWEKIVNSTLTSLITALMIGFFAMVWTWGTRFNEQTEKSNKAVAELGVRLDAVQETFKNELASFKASQITAVAAVAPKPAITNTPVAPAPALNAANFAEEINKNAEKTQWKINEYIRSKKGESSP